MPQERLLALEVRPQRIGFVVLQGTTKLLDWGIRMHDKNDVPSVACARVATLMNLYSPTVMVIRRRDTSTPLRSAISDIVATLTAEARRRSICCRFVTVKEVRCFFSRHNGTTKHAIASLLSGWYPDLAWRLPRKRRAWESEPFSMALFDAAAAAVTYFGITEH